MADCMRMAEQVSSGTPIHMIVIYYKQVDYNTKKLSNIIEVDLTNSYELLFGSISRTQIQELVNLVKSVPPKTKPTDEQHQKIYSIKNNLQKLCGYIGLNVKCNSTQSRLQCSIRKFQEFLKNNPTRIVAFSNNNEFKGGFICDEIVSQPREFKKKANE